MFAAKIAKPRAKVVEGSTSDFMPRRSTLVGHRLVHDPIGQAASTRWNMTSQEALPAASWDFSKIALFPRAMTRAAAPDGVANSRRTAGSDTRSDDVGDGLTLTDQSDGGAPPAPAPSPSPSPPSTSVGPIAVRNGPFHAPIDTPTTAGMEIAITITSSSGVDADMASIQDSEQVSLSFNHTGSFSGLAPLPSNQSGFMPGFPIPNDRHAIPKSLLIDRGDNHGGDGSIDKNQLDVFTAPAIGVPSPAPIPASGYLIRRSIKSGPGTRLVLRTEKSPNACTVNGFTTTAGPSPTQADEVVVRA